MSARDRTGLLALAAFVIAIPALLAFSGTIEALGYLSPLLVLLGLLLHGRYPGEQVLGRAARSVARPAVTLRRRLGVPRPARTMVARGGALIATSLAVRPPPELARI